MNKKNRLILRLIMLVMIAAGIYMVISQRGAPDNKIDLSQPSNFDINHAVNLHGPNTDRFDPALRVTDEEKQAFIEESRKLGILYKDLFLQAKKIYRPIGI